jgi:gamma-glutamyl-gamma-aminobutyrate hydrolase PuuD
MEIGRRVDKARVLPGEKVASAQQSTPTTHEVRGGSKGPIRGASVATSVGGKAVAGHVELVRIPGRDVDVMLPRGVDFHGYVSALIKSGAFPAQSAELAKLVEMAATPAPPPDKRPIVGVVISEPRMLVKDVHKNTENILALVEAMGCRPVIVPPCADLTVPGGPAARERTWAAMASQLDGLVGPGGADVDPSIYGAETTHSVNTNLLRDTFEAGFVKVALDCDLFAFGICRSHQLWNAAAGGSLVQDIQHDGLTSVSHKEGEHPLRVSRRSMIFETTRQEALRVNSLHHQAVDFTGWGFRVVGRTLDEGTGKEMIEATERWNGITTQYHPELMQEDPAQRRLFSTVGRRAHVFALVKELRKAGPVTLPQVLERMRDDARYDPSDVAWAKRELTRRLG